MSIPKPNGLISSGVRGRIIFQGALLPLAPGWLRPCAGGEKLPELGGFKKLVTKNAF